MNQAIPAGAAESSKAARHWPAHLDLAFRRRNGRTELARKAHRGPLRVQRLFYPDAHGKAHCYLLHPPGGIVLGDELTLDIEVTSGAALVTTPSAGRFYTVAGFAEHQSQNVNLRARAGLLEWLPQETILFPGARARTRTDIDLAADARLAFWEVLVLGRPAAGEVFDAGSCEQDLCIRRGATPLFRERLALHAGDRLSRSPQGLRGHSTTGIAVFTARAARDLFEAWLEAVNGPGRTGCFSITQRGDLLLARYLGEDAQACRAGFSSLWRAVTRERDGVEPAEPRIWHT